MKARQGGGERSALLRARRRAARNLDGRRSRPAKGSRAYRAASCAAHKCPSHAAVLLTSPLLASLAGSSRDRPPADAAARERDAAQRERDGAKAVTDLLIDIFKVADPESGAGTQLSARDLLDRGSARVVDGLGDEPEIQARLLHALGRVYQNLGLFEEATTKMERARVRTPTTDTPRPTAGGERLAWVPLRNEMARAEPLSGRQ